MLGFFMNLQIYMMVKVNEIKLFQVTDILEQTPSFFCICTQNFKKGKYPNDP